MFLEIDHKLFRFQVNFVSPHAFSRWNLNCEGHSSNWWAGTVMRALGHGLDPEPKIPFKFHHFPFGILLCWFPGDTFALAHDPPLLVPPPPLLPEWDSRFSFSTKPFKFWPTVHKNEAIESHLIFQFLWNEASFRLRGKGDVQVSFLR